jgi:hypothetical protein
MIKKINHKNVFINKTIFEIVVERQIEFYLKIQISISVDSS